MTSLSGSVAGAPTPFEVTAKVVASIDDIAIFSIDATDASVSTIGANGAAFCLLAESGGTPIAGATWSFTVSANLATTDGSLFSATSCIMVTGTADGTGTLTATASGFSKTFSFEVSTKKRSAPRRSLQRTAPRPVAGERAAGMGSAE